ncbi:MAG: hypothetical protein C0601_03990 [Candidatus Muiribacterium halophilum]|uniref:Uncharacterized protein n=1 Tax=Muiribacterium halophilum TaxID=2053465 RepID=A0A2N5ZJD8_MUIH1|nr:MAG: hypothetical protein C0601_03990 [Candidatus Muirbacterium halophilum]
MDLKSKVREITNIVAGRFVVVFNEFFGGILDIGVPVEQKNIEDLELKKHPYLSFLARIDTGKGYISILFMVLKEEFSNFSENPEEFFSELFDGMENVILDTLDSMELGDEIKINKIEFIPDDENVLDKEMSCRKADGFSFAPIFFKEDKREFCGLFVIG